MPSKQFRIEKDWRFKLGIIFVMLGITASTLMLYFPPYELKDNASIEFNKTDGSGKFPVHQLPPLLAVGVGVSMFVWTFMARRQWNKIHAEAAKLDSLIAKSKRR